MDLNLTDEQLNTLPKDVLIALFIAMRSELKSTNEQLAAVNHRLDVLTEQITLSNNYRFGRHTEKGSGLSGQLSFNEDGVFFNEAETANDACPDPKEVSIEEIVRNRRSRPVGKSRRISKALRLCSFRFVMCQRKNGSKHSLLSTTAGEWMMKYIIA